jgi:hypothetical protein
MDWFVASDVVDGAHQLHDGLQQALCTHKQHAKIVGGPRGLFYTRTVMGTHVQ